LTPQCGPSAAQHQMDPEALALQETMPEVPPGKRVAADKWNYLCINLAVRNAMLK
jgi:hypothetical protein